MLKSIEDVNKGENGYSQNMSSASKYGNHPGGPSETSYMLAETETKTVKNRILSRHENKRRLINTESKRESYGEN
jgi:hypothetical protein